jgi:anaerobic dimethyl sulfoxide reductase subunit C (anchor subunit)
MIGKEWSLIVFSLAMQLSAGIILIYDLFLLSPLYRTRIDIPARFQWILMIALSAAVVGLVFSLVHLGNPGNATRTLANLGSSWLSREIISVLVFTALLAVVTILHFTMPSAARSLKWLVDLTAIAGLVVVFIMSRIYMIPTRPAWNSAFTPLGFYLAAILLGASLLLIFQINHGSWASQKALAILTFSIPLVQLAILPVFMAWLGQKDMVSGNALAIILDRHMAAFYLRLGFYILAIGFGLWAFFSIRSDTLQNRLLFTPAIMAWAAILAAQIIDRYLFYAQNLPAEGF